MILFYYTKIYFFCTFNTVSLYSVERVTFSIAKRTHGNVVKTPFDFYNFFTKSSGRKILDWLCEVYVNFFNEY